MVVQFVGSSAVETLRIAAAVAGKGQLVPFQTSLERLQASIQDDETMVEVWRRDSTLYGLVPLIDVDGTGRPEETPQLGRLLRFVTDLNSPVFLLCRERLALAGVRDFCIEIPTTSAQEQFAIWQSVLPDPDANRQLAGELARQFTVDLATASEVVKAAQLAENDQTDPELRTSVWRECRERSRPQLEGLAQRIDVKANWDDLVVSQSRRESLQQIRDQVRSRWCVYDQWGWASRMNRGLGIATLFAGESGTGKTMAAEVLANDLDLDLYRVDLSTVVNKYIGETEKQATLCQSCPPGYE